MAYRPVYEGTVRLRFNPDTNVVYLDRGVSGSTLTAKDASRIAELALEAATAHKASLNRWTFYVAGENQKLPKKGEKGYESSTLPVAALKKALKEGYKASLRLGNGYGKPNLWLLPPDEAKPATAKSNIIDIA